MNSEILDHGEIWISTGVVPSRVVLRAIMKDDGQVREYATHVELLDPKTGAHNEYIWGHYFPATADGYEAATQDFKTRVAEKH